MEKYIVFGIGVLVTLGCILVLENIEKRRYCCYAI